MPRTSLIGAVLNRATPAPDLPAPYTSRTANTALFGGLRGAEAQMRAMGSVGTLFAIVNRLSVSTAAVEWNLWRKAKSGRKEDRTLVTSHAALDLWQRPNRFYTRQELVETTGQHVDLTGEGWWVIASSAAASMPLELWPVRPDRMTPVPSPTKFLSGYIYTGADGQQIPLGLDDVIQIRMPNPLDPYRGMGPVQAVLADLDAVRYSAEWNRNFFLNSAEPGGIIQVPSNLNDEDFARLRMRWNEQHRGVAAAHRVAILEGEGTQWVDRKITQRDMQFAELRTVTTDVIREAFTMPGFALGDVDDVNRATADASTAWFAAQLTVPRLERFKQALNFDLLPLFGNTTRDLEFDYASPIPPDLETEAAQLTARSNAAAILIEAGLDPVDVLSACELPAMRYVGVPAAAPTPAPARPSDRAPLAVARPAAPAPRASAAEDEGQTELAEVRAAYTAALDALIADWDTRVLPGQIADIVGQVQKAIDADDPAALSGLRVDADTAVRTLRTALADTADGAARQMAAEAADQGVTVDVPMVDAGLRAHLGLVLNFGGELVSIAVGVAGLIASDLAASAGREALRLYTPGADGSSIAAAVGNFLRGLKNRALVDQLGGALHRAINVGRIATLRKAPTAIYLSSEVMDGATCPPCRAIDGTVFANLDAAETAYGAGPYRNCQGGIRCRGTVVAIWEDQ